MDVNSVGFTEDQIAAIRQLTKRDAVYIDSQDQINTGILRPAMVTAMPTQGLYNGQEVYYTADSADGAVWRFRYNGNSTSTYKWEFVGGAPLLDDVNTLENTTSAGYTDLGTVGPTLTIPLSGDYDVAWGAHSTCTAATAILRIGVKRGSAATSDNQSIVNQPAGASYQSAGQSQRILRLTGCTAGDVYKLQYNTNAGTAGFERRWLTITPVRVS